MLQTNTPLLIHCPLFSNDYRLLFAYCHIIYLLSGYKHNMKDIKNMQFIANQGFRTITYINAILSTNIFQNRADLKANGHIKQVKLLFTSYFLCVFLFLLKIYYRQLYFLKIMLISSLRCGRVLTLQWCNMFAVFHNTFIHLIL